MQTELVKGREVAEDDESIMELLSPVNSQRLSAGTAIRFGIQNESGQLYRIIMLEDVMAFGRAIRLLRHHYWVEPLEIEDSTDLLALVQTPSLAKVASAAEE